MASNSLELDPSAIPEQIIQESFIQRKISRSIKPISLKMECVLRYSKGQSKARIARELSITNNTVAAILKECEFEKFVSDGAKFGVNSLAFESVETVAHHVGKKNLKAAMYVLDKTVFVEESGSRNFTQNVQVNVAIPRAKVLVNNMPIEAKALPETAEVLPVNTTTK